MHKNILALLGTTALIAVLAEPVAAQSQSRSSQSQTQAEPSQGQKPDAGQQRAQQSPQAMTDQEFVREAAIVNMFEIQAGEIARNKAQDQEIRDFAQQIIQDHQRMQDRLSQSAGNANVPSQLDQRHSKLIDRLERVSGKRFDGRFIRMQIQGHEQAIDHFETYIEARQERGQDNAQRQQKDASGSLLQYAQQNLPALRRHLQTAQTIEDAQRSPDVAARQSQEGRTSRQSQADDSRSQQSGSRDDQAARRLVIEQPRPRVAVTDPRSQVSVQQPRPQVTVRQQPPTVTIEQPPPEIIVQMPRPEVDVQNRQPRVSVNVPRPEVRVEQQGDSARVQVQRPSADEAQVQYERARPQVKFERTGQPRVVYRSTQQEPNVRYESAGEPDGAQNPQATADQSRQSGQDRRQSDAQANRQQQTSAQAGQQTDASQKQATRQQASETDEEWRKQARELAGDEDASTATTGTAAGAPSGTVLTVGQIMDMSVYNARGQKLGEVEDVVVDQTNDRKFVVLASGGFLGMFEDEIALPLERFSARGDRLVVSGLSEADIDNMQDWEDRVPNNRGLDENNSVRVGG